MRHYRSDLLPIPTCLLVPTIPCFFRGILERRPCKAVDMGPSWSASVCSFSEAAMQHYNGHNGYGSMSSSYPAGSGPPTGCRWFRWIPAEPGISVAPQRPCTTKNMDNNLRFHFIRREHPRVWALSHWFWSFLGPGQENIEEGRTHPQTFPQVSLRRLA